MMCKYCRAREIEDWEIMCEHCYNSGKLDEEGIDKEIEDISEMGE